MNFRIKVFCLQLFSNYCFTRSSRGFWTLVGDSTLFWEVVTAGLTSPLTSGFGGSCWTGLGSSLSLYWIFAGFLTYWTVEPFGCSTVVADSANLFWIGWTTGAFYEGTSLVSGFFYSFFYGWVVLASLLWVATTEGFSTIFSFFSSYLWVILLDPSSFCGGADSIS